MKRIASLLLLAGACGKVSALADAGADDAPAAADARSADAGPDARTAVHVTVYGPDGSRAPSAGVPVVFTDPEGAVAAQTTSAVDGTASAELPRGGSVTAVWLAAPNRYAIQTIEGVRPGDDLALVGEGSDVTQVGLYNVSWPALPGAATIFVFAGCGASFAEPNATSGIATIYASCKRDVMTVAVTAYTPDGQIMGYLEQRDVPYVDGGHTAFAGPWQTPGTFNAAITGLSPTVESYAYVDRFVGDSYGTDANASGAVAGATLSLQAPAPTSPSPALVRTDVVRAGATNQVDQIFEQPITGGSLAYSFDVGAHLLPWVDVPSLDLATATVTVPSTGSGTPDVAFVSVGYGRPSAGGSTTFEWMVIGANADRPIALPRLPASVGDVNPAAGDFVDGGIVRLLETDAIAGYDQVRGDPFAALSLAVSGHTSATLVRVSAAVPGGG